MLAQIQMPQSIMKVIEGQKVVLQAWYSTSYSIGKNTVLWNFVANNSQLVSVCALLCSVCGAFSICADCLTVWGRSYLRRVQ